MCLFVNLSHVNEEIFTWLPAPQDDVLSRYRLPSNALMIGKRCTDAGEALQWPAC